MMSNETKKDLQLAGSELKGLGSALFRLGKAAVVGTVKAVGSVAVPENIGKALAYKDTYLDRVNAARDSANDEYAKNNPEYAQILELRRQEEELRRQRLDLMKRK